MTPDNTGNDKKRLLLIGSGVVGLSVLLAALVVSLKTTDRTRSITSKPVPLAVQPAVTSTRRPGSPQKLPATFTNRLGMEFVLVGRGTAWLGGGIGKQGEKTAEIPHDFYLGAFEVTQEEWERVTGRTPGHFSRNGAGKDTVKNIPDTDLKQFPIENVSWDDAQLFLEGLNAREKEAGWIYRLPTEAEWEYACRGGPLSNKVESEFDFFFDKPANQLLPDQANFAPEPGQGLQRTCTVGSYPPNRLGLYDMHGNVWEWCDDTEKPVDGSLLRVYRGGCWHHVAGHCRAAIRSALPPSNRGYYLGLRLARVPVDSVGK